MDSAPIKGISGVAKGRFVTFFGLGMAALSAPPSTPPPVAAAAAADAEDDAQAAAAAAAAPPPSFRVVTWNVFFGALEYARRWDALLTEALAAGPAVVAFQEVTQSFHTQCRAHPSVVAGGYTCAGRPRMVTRHGYDVMRYAYDVSVWVRRGVRVRGAWSVRLPTTFERRGLVVDAELPGGCRVRVCTVHLESMKSNARRRAEQLAILLPLLKRGDKFGAFNPNQLPEEQSAPNSNPAESGAGRGTASVGRSFSLAGGVRKALFGSSTRSEQHSAAAPAAAPVPAGACKADDGGSTSSSGSSCAGSDKVKAPPDAVFLVGDFNLCASWSENLTIHADPAVCDVWAHLRPGDAGFTEDTRVNIMRFNAKRKHKQVRFDRVLLVKAGDDDGDEAASTESTAAVRPASIRMLGMRPLDGMPEVFPSDHFGLSAGFYQRSACPPS